MDSPRCSINAAEPSTTIKALALISSGLRKRASFPSHGFST